MNTLAKGFGVISLAALLTACGNTATDKENEKTQEHSHEEHSHKEHEKAHEHDHGHDHHHMSEADKKIYEGYFEDSQVKDRALTDWEGDWQSVYPFLKDGTLDKVFEHKAKEKPSMTAKEYKDYYTTGYKTDVSRINIGKENIDFYKGDEKYSGKYIYDGKEILNYEKGNRGVRFIFKKVSGDNQAPKFIQFSDHSIAPKRAEHFHIYMGNERAALLKEMEHWPTYYFSDMTGDEIAEEIMAH
ncbi:metal-binding protein ZinT [Macrococcus hajekii]|uniref:Metal-binding protein ZinT n=1 Tax=Macrococcus hajekii TaxID=198482 RepID=A0A4R6BJQ8_9STAP|nr:metal-binding protein ZinT [Macrococcus hajekii]TDM01952.1 metal-binding protein ZinT [Macrococcus hajekii]GGB08794.1 metal-binding protein [Macrococcus hajekii]